MKKAIYFILFPILFGSLSGVLTESVICSLAVLTSPFVELHEIRFLAFSGVISLLAILILAATVFFYVRYLLNTNEKGKIKKSIFIQFLIAIPFFVSFWLLAEFVFKCVYSL